MHKTETRYPCPVCLGVAMEKVRVGSEGVVLDHCARCGGAWFELGEVQQLRRAKPEELWGAIVPRDEVYRAQCHSCHTPMDRSEATCPTCGQEDLLDCPICQKRMHVAGHGSLRLDTCTDCKGVWFDHHELASVWQLELSTALERRRARGDFDMTGSDGAVALLDVLMWHPGMVFYGAHAAGQVMSASINALGNAPEAATGMVEVAGEAAAGVFETILEIISGFFN